MERITTVRLAEALSQSGLVANEKITDALYQQDSTGLPFVDVLVETGEVSEWELARVVVQHFQLPFLMASSFEINRSAVEALPENFLFEHRLLPLDLSGSVLNLSMPVLTPFKVLQHAQNLSGKNVFPFVGLGSENTKFLYQMFPQHSREELGARPENPKGGGGGGGGGGGRGGRDDGAWQNIFDVGDQEVLKDLNT